MWFPAGQTVICVRAAAELTPSEGGPCPPLLPLAVRTGLAPALPSAIGNIEFDMRTGVTTRALACGCPVAQLFFERRPERERRRRPLGSRTGYLLAVRKGNPAARSWPTAQKVGLPRFCNRNGPIPIGQCIPGQYHNAVACGYLWRNCLEGRRAERRRRFWFAVVTSVGRGTLPLLAPAVRKLACPRPVTQTVNLPF